MADVVIFNKEPPPGIPKDAKKFCRDDVEECINYITRLIREYRDRQNNLEKWLLTEGIFMHAIFS